MTAPTRSRLHRTSIRILGLYNLPGRRESRPDLGPGGAQALGLAIDKSELVEVIGTIAGDDTVLVICADDRDARALADKLQPNQQRSMP